jgi:ubiquinone/menaquinone biosynthesis C-methylase UbiE
MQMNGVVHMPIDFHAQENRYTYATRQANSSWMTIVNSIAAVNGKRALEIGCGEGIYTKALASMGAASVTCLDSSREMLQSARKNCSGYANIDFVLGSALGTGLLAERYDLVLQRAIIHHLAQNDLRTCFVEAFRLLRPGGMLIVQDRTPEDCLLPGSKMRTCGYFFSRYPRFVNLEVTHGPGSELVLQTLRQVGFQSVEERKLWETRAVYPNLEALSEDLLARTDRSILHELTDAEQQDLVTHITYVQEQLQAAGDAEIVEEDCWTIWSAVK